MRVLKYTITGKPKGIGNYKLDFDFEITWKDGKIVEGNWQSKALLRRENALQYGKHLGHPVGPCPGAHNHIEDDECFCDLIVNILKPGYKVITEMDDGEVIEGWDEPDYSDIPEDAFL